MSAPRTTTINYNGFPCHFRFLQFDEKPSTRKMKCAISGNTIKSSDGFYICINNHMLFPNVFISSEKIKDWGMPKCAESLSKEWNTIQDMKDGGWK
mgnify:CR=1 FL=1